MSNIEQSWPAERGSVPRQTPAEILDELRQEFAPIVLRLTPDVEPAVVFRPDSNKKETGS